MSSKVSMTLFRSIAWFASFYHIVLGLVATFSSGEFAMSLANKIYGVNINIEADLFMSLARFSGSYMIAFGLAMALLALKPFAYRHLAWIGAILIFIRIFDRVAYYSILEKSLGVTLISSLPTLLVISVMAIGLILLMPKKK